ncbi:hypothetical protein [Ornithinibacillus bavariensis]|uniref:LysM domain-containing protein n=1 Tax=Ornithinibacillus bavariensis TaxID=545502 RepID=A0A919XBD4_9BACI|nr:hypothetical protein [Ornithinibacillus bavariensis]GIO27560.1 hypothetical protein J43TS3_21710 [Ornithinibacillus bavariensis]
MKKLIITILIILFMVSIYKDIYYGTDLSSKNKLVPAPTEKLNVVSFEAVKVKLGPGDTVLTVVERLNPESSDLDIEKVLNDFSSLNPNSDPERLKINHFYFFPKY